MTPEEKFLHLVTNHNIAGRTRDGRGGYCMIGAIGEAYESLDGYRQSLDDINQIISTDFPDLFSEVKQSAKNPEGLGFIAYFNDHYSTHEDRVLVAKKFVESRNG